MTMAHNIAWGLVRNFFEQKRKTNPTWKSTTQIEFTRGTSRSSWL